MKPLQILGLTASISAAIALASCGGGGSSSAPTGTIISGTASAPSGGIALFEPKNTFELAMDFIIRPAAAAITGLQGLNGATVELIQIDDSGNQIGDVLATTTTSSTGHYTITLPTGTSLAGDLILRISGIGGAQMRAQVVETSVDITPVTEYVLQNFISNAVDLSSLSTSSVVQLTGYIEDFDLTAGAVDLTDLLANLNQEAGQFIDNQIDIITTTPGNGSSIAGNYRHASFEPGLHDDDGQYQSSTVSMDQYWNNITLVDAGNGQVTANITSGAGNWSLLQIISSMPVLSYFTEIEGADSFSAQFGSNNVLNVTVPFSEELDTNNGFGWRFAPHQARFQKAMNSDVFVAASENAGVRYSLNNANTAIDDAAREGDEVFRGIDILFKKPTAATAADLNGDYGMVGLNVTQRTSGNIAELFTENRVLSFNGVDTMTLGTNTMHNLGIGAAGVNQYASSNGSTPSMTYGVSTDGTLSLDAEVAGYFNNDMDLFVVNEASTVDDGNNADEYYDEVSYDMTLAVKQPASLLTLDGRSYRVMMLMGELDLDDSDTISLANFRFATTLNITDATNGVVNGNGSTVLRVGAPPSPISEVGVEEWTLTTDTAATISLQADGSMTVSFTDTNGTMILDGYMNHDGSLGVFNVRFTATGDTDPSALGMAILLQI